MGGESRKWFSCLKAETVCFVQWAEPGKTWTCARNCAYRMHTFLFLRCSQGWEHLAYDDVDASNLIMYRERSDWGQVIHKLYREWSVSSVEGGYRPWPNRDPTVTHSYPPWPYRYLNFYLLVCVMVGYRLGNDGVTVGSRPYHGEVPMCRNINSSRDISA